MTTQELKNYYNKKFPIELIYKMIIMNNNQLLSQNRDVKFVNTDRLWITNFNRENVNVLKDKINSIYNLINIHMSIIIKTNQKADLEIKHIYKELVFDIDITDYNRFCECREFKKGVCDICWLHMEGSYLILNHFLLNRLGYKKENLLWEFSGSKGIHCFINEKKAIKLSNEERINLFNLIYIENDDHKKLNQFIKLYQKEFPDFIKEIENHFYKNVIIKRNLFSFKEFNNYFLSIIKDHYNQIFYHIINQWENNNNNQEKEDSNIILDDENESTRKWKLFIKYEDLFYTYRANRMTIKENDYVKPSLFIIFSLYNIKLDRGPLTLNHNIKLPFSVHSESKNIALPMEGDKILSFQLDKDVIPLSNIDLDKFNDSILLFEKWIKNYPFEL